MTTLQEQQAEIQQAESKLSYYQQKLKTETDPRRRDKWIEYVTAWRRGVELVRKGYTLSGVSTWAAQTASGEIAHALDIETAEMEAAKQAAAGTELKSQEEIAAITGIPISQLKSREEISRMLSRPSTTGVFAYPTTYGPSDLKPREQLEESPFGFGTTYGVPEKAPTYEKPSPWMISAVEKPTGLIERGIFETEGIRARVTTKALRGEVSVSSAVYGFGAGAVASVYGGALFIKKAITQPIQTTK